MVNSYTYTYTTESFFSESTNANLRSRRRRTTHTNTYTRRRWNRRMNQIKMNIRKQENNNQPLKKDTIQNNELNCLKIIFIGQGGISNSTRSLLARTGLEWSELNWIGWIGLDWIGSNRIGLNWIGLRSRMSLVFIYSTTQCSRSIQSSYNKYATQSIYIKI